MTRHPLRLWTGWVVGIIAWTLHLIASYLLVSWVCATGNYWALHGVTLATLAMSVAGGWVAWRQWSEVGRQWPDAGDPQAQTSRIRFMAVGGLMISGLSALLIVAEGIPNFFLSACL
ncbi:hypothetical protein LG290_04900 [Halomonas sediminis]|uniref:Uncharacterized protein n=1 Tax=Vreelandella zhuhanensis TaxID=2684210 RepID=A0A7X3GZU9_9GAMM|nr:hypothetical protein [Halomonas zhuhanensis]MWJ26980.1 hypothetical protein [Halomonas zhuhanensis]